MSVKLFRLPELRANQPKITEVVPKKTPRVQTEIGELNRVLGGGVVPGSLILLGGDPGIGKSTLLLQVSEQLTKAHGKSCTSQGKKVLSKSRCVRNV